jgi:hypothetical protein
MDETDVGRVLAAAAPETVPAIGSQLLERARSSGKRRRVRRTVMTGGGAGVAVAAVVGTVAAFGGFGSGQQSQVPAASGGPLGVTSPVVHTVPPSPGATWSPGELTSPVGQAAPTSPAGKPSGFEQPDIDPVANAKVLAAVKAALPAPDRDKLQLYRGAGQSTGYGAEFNMGQAVLDVSVARYVQEPPGDTPTMCASDLQHCTKGTATLHGHQVRWEYYYGDLGSPSLNVYDEQGGINYLVAASGQNKSQLPGLTEMKDVGLNEQVAATLLDAWPKH